MYWLLECTASAAAHSQCPWWSACGKAVMCFRRYSISNKLLIAGQKLQILQHLCTLIRKFASRSLFSGKCVSVGKHNHSSFIKDESSDSWTCTGRWEVRLLTHCHDTSISSSLQHKSKQHLWALWSMILRFLQNEASNMTYFCHRFFRLDLNSSKDSG